MMRQKHASGSDLPHQAHEPAATRGASTGLGAIGTELELSDVNGKPETGRMGRNLLGNASAIGVDPMIGMGDDQLQATCVGLAVQQLQQCERVGAPRYGHEPPAGSHVEAVQAASKRAPDLEIEGEPSGQQHLRAQPRAPAQRRGQSGG